MAWVAVQKRLGPGERMTRYFSEAGGVKEKLEVGVHVSCRTLVFQPGISRSLP